jgi:hypothetical protein
MSGPPEPIGPLFPIGGPVPPELIIGRTGEIQDLERRVGEGISTMLVGPRRIGKTTVCAAVCEKLKVEGALVVKIDVPERSDSGDLLQLIIDVCSRISIADHARKGLRFMRPLIEKILSEQGVPLDLSTLTDGTALPSRAVLQLPVELARRENRRALVFLDELQRVVTYEDAEQTLGDLIDIYGGSAEAVVLIDGSAERALDGMFGEPVHFGKLADRLELAVSIPADSWREPLTDRFERAGLGIPPEILERLLQWSECRPYATMAAARYAALNARKTGSAEIDDFDLQMGIDEAKRHLEDDGA